jgi:RNA polymerase sigma-70 factor, ECF subfamily
MDEGSTEKDAVESGPTIQSPRSAANPVAEGAALAHVRAGRCDEALKVLMTTYGTHITAFALRMVRDADIARDLHQQVFLDAFQGITKFEGRSSLWRWLCGITYHRCMDELRHRRRVALGDDFDVWERLDTPPDPVMDADQLAMRRALEACMAKLPVAMRAQLLMRFHWGMTYVEIGEMVGDPDGTVQVRISRILPRLRRCLRNEGVAR